MMVWPDDQCLQNEDYADYVNRTHGWADSSKAVQYHEELYANDVNVSFQTKCNIRIQ